MDSPSDITAVFRMRKDFDSFIRGQQDDATLRLNLDKNVFTSFSERRKHASEAEAIKAQIGQLYISFKNQMNIPLIFINSNVSLLFVFHKYDVKN